MASEEGGLGGEESNGSLFEGMVVFNPDEVPSAPPAPAPAPPPAHPAPAPSPVAQPLDEDLFSDLTLQIQNPLNHPPDPPTPTPNVNPPPSRQLSRKKKRAVRVGYARDNAVPDESHLPSPSPSFATPLPQEPPLPYDLGLDAAAAAAAAAHSDVRREVEDAAEEEVRAEDGGSCATLLPDAEEEEEEEEEKEEEKAVEISSPSDPGPGAGLPSEKEDAFGSIEDKLALIRSRISEKLDSIRHRAASAAAQRKELRRRRRKVAGDANSASARYEELERELEEACEAEDFERAERISESLAAVEREKDELLIALKDAGVECDAVDSKMQEVLELQIAAEEEGAGLLQQFAKDAADYANLVQKNAEEVSSKELETWQASMELLEIKKLEMDVQSTLILEAHSGLDEAIEQLVEDDRRQKNMLKRKGDVLAKELGELLELVRLKEAEIADNDRQIQEVEKKISDVVAAFNETQSSIDLKHANQLSAQSKVDSESEALVIKKNEIDNFLSVTEQKRSKLMELASVTSDEAKTCQDLVRLRKNLASSCLKSTQDRVRLGKMEEKIMEDIQGLKQQMASARTSLQELSSTRASMQQAIASFQERISFINKRGPELEAEKKVAAAARNFKEAGRIASEAKALNIEKEDLQNRWEKAAIDLEKLELDIRGTSDKIQESEGLILLKEKEAAMAGYRKLRLISAGDKAERSYALEMGDFEEGDVLLQEAEAAESKAKELQESYGLQPEEDGNTWQHVVSIEYITNLAGQHLAEMASTFNIMTGSDRNHSR